MRICNIWIRILYELQNKSVPIVNIVLILNFLDLLEFVRLRLSMLRARQAIFIDLSLIDCHLDEVWCLSIVCLDERNDLLHRCLIPIIEWT
jgi:hypothetical protein